MDALARDLIERLHAEGVSTVYVGDLTGILKTHWLVEANAKTHNFWAFRAFLNRLTYTAEEYGMEVEARSEAWTSQEYPDCGERDETVRHGDTLTCPCGFEGHADLTASATFLNQHTDSEVGAMARPVRFKWDAHTWGESSHFRLNEVRTHQQKTFVGVSAEQTPTEGIPRLQTWEDVKLFYMVVIGSDGYSIWKPRAY